ncbi:hypothetical protein VCUG_02451 [Vavraia culicis subsp. floridensis]|uniref:RRM domain-containing protein n=1 Tax=Vavraia culicis (isolate floridensis) TaxID=948595 RepID=L2GSJ6_VAVCU|nr:uncharacterized protein VCUG_02451 [Vavraia culicis subsp. floridensis]ELA46060.1 hypothetical protein VCUG_02451 [Vavraia culicis subsp. floridensis]
MKIKVEFDEENSKESKRMKKEDGRREGAVDQTESGNEGMDEKEGIITMDDSMREEEIGCRKFDGKNQALNTELINMNGNCEAEERVDCVEEVGERDENTKRGEEGKGDKGRLGAVFRIDQVKEQEMIESDRKDEVVEESDEKDEVVEESDRKDEVVEESGRESKTESDRNFETGSEKEHGLNGMAENSKKEDEIKKDGRVVGAYKEQETAHTADKVSDTDEDNDLQRLQRMQDQFLQKEEPVTANSVIIRNLDHTITRQVLIKHLHACGTIKSVEIPQVRKAGQSKQITKNYAFVEFMNRSSVDIAMSLNNKLVINGKRVSIGRKKVFNK